LPIFAGADREEFVVVLLDAKHRPIGINTVSIGSLTASIVHPREVFKPAIAGNSAALLLAHNHPSGDPTPSAEDIDSRSASAKRASWSVSASSTT
jgi:DNA repair protein RadC